MKIEVDVKRRHWHSLRANIAWAVAFAAMTVWAAIDSARDFNDGRTGWGIFGVALTAWFLFMTADHIAGALKARKERKGAKA